MRRWLPGRVARARPPYKLLSLLLQYPDERLVAAEGELARALAELPASAAKGALERFWAGWAGTPALARAQRYVETFDLHKRCSLYLSFYQLGDRRQRGVGLVRLKRMYAAAGLVMDGGELPDYLPLMLEFAALAPEGYGEAVLAEHRPAIEVLRAALAETRSPYAHLLDALRAGLPPLTPLEAAQIERLVAEGPPGERVGLEPFAPPEVMPREEARR